MGDTIAEAQPPAVDVKTETDATETVAPVTVETETVETTEETLATDGMEVDSEVKTEAKTEGEADATAVDMKTVDEAAQDDSAAKPTTDEKSAPADKVTNNKQTAKNGDKPGPMLKARAKVDKQDYSKNRKYDASKLEPSEDPDLINGQVEFYFSDSNISQDKFLREAIGGEENKPISLKLLCSFNRMRRFPYAAVVPALKKNKLFVIEGAEGEETVKRKVAWVPKSEEEIARIARSVYVKGFGDEKPETQFAIEGWFAKFGTVNCVRLRRQTNKGFKGSAFCEFQSEELAKDFLALTPPPTWEGHELRILSKKDYMDEKEQEIKEGKINPTTHNQRCQARGNFKGDKNDWKNRKEHEQKQGFKHRGQGGHRGRGNGNRGGNRGRGGRGGGRGGHGGDDRRRQERAAPAESTGGKPVIQATNEKGEVVKPNTEKSNGKRPREDDGGAAQPPAKKVDAKPAATAEA